MACTSTSVPVGDVEPARSAGSNGLVGARMLHLLAEERAATQAVADRVELVWSGTDRLTATSRDTAVVV